MRAHTQAAQVSQQLTQQTPQQRRREVKKLLTLLNSRPPNRQLPSIDIQDASLATSVQWPVPTEGGSFHSTEANALEQFSSTYQSERKFSSHPEHEYFTELFSALVKHRLSNRSWTQRASPENVFRVLVCLRILMRDPTYQKIFVDLDGTKVLSEHLRKATDSYLTYGDGPFVVDILKEMTNVFQKLSVVESQRQCLVGCGAHKTLVLLLSANDVVVLHCSLYALTGLAQSAKPRSLIAELNFIEILLRILQDYDLVSKKLAANLLRLLCADAQARELVLVYDGIPILLSLLHSDSVCLLRNVVWCLVQLAEDEESSCDIRQMGGIPLLLSLLHERKFVSERQTATSCPASATVKSPAVTEEDVWNWSAATDSSALVKSEEVKEPSLRLKSACCACLTELVANDTNAHQVVQSNGIYLLCLLVMPSRSTTTHYPKSVFTNLQANAFRTLRFLFSLERNRRLFKRLFPPDLFENFIDVGAYKRDFKHYKSLVEKLNSLSEETLEEIQENIESTNQNKAPSHRICEYAVLELLGSGAFGSVYKVKKQTAGQSYLAMKEVNTMNPSWGKSSRERQKSLGEVVSELTIIREKLQHPNIVRYYRTFVEQDKLYIVMELIEGAPLGEHFSSLKEKGETFSEDRIWNIFLQMVLALRYLHKEKNIVHRDLTPNNIMLGENDKVKITDFGLAKQKQKDCSKMISVVGTILYSCPEIVQNLPYGEKADIWAVGCILHQMCTLNPPFYSNNMLSLATKIVQADYEALPEGMYSEKVSSTITKCLTADAEQRPDIVQVAAHIAEIMLNHMDRLSSDQIKLEKKLEKERTRTIRHFNEAHRNMQRFHKLFVVSQERYDKLANLESSGSGVSIKDDQELSDRLCGIEQTAKRQPSSTTTVEDEVFQENGWISDDDNSSGSECKESTTDVRDKPILRRVDSYPGIQPRPPAGSPRERRKHKNPAQYSKQLTLEIPSAKNSRDSGLSSGDPSPNNSSSSNTSNSVNIRTESREQLTKRSRSVGGVPRSVSSPTLETAQRKALGGGRVRPISANTAMLTISPLKVREISDPILQLLHILHKIIYITQLPPTLCHNPRRRVIEKFKRALFVPQSTSVNLKNELRKLLQGSREILDLNLGPSESLKLSRQITLEREALANNSTDVSGMEVYDTEAGDVGITYEQMHSIIETVLVESGYYDMLPGTTRQRTLPGTTSVLNNTKSA